MSRQKKDNPDKPATQRNSQLGKQIHSDQLIALQGQLDLCQQQRRQLIQSRNYAIIAAVIACMAVLYHFFIKPPVDCTGQQQAVVARQLAAHKKQLTNQKCIEETIQQATIIDSDQTITDNVRQTLSKIENKLYGENQTPIGSNGEPEKLSTVLDRLTGPEANQPVSQSREKQAISRMLHLWAVAWELKDLPTYFSYYSKNFDPQGLASDLQEWKAFRSYRIDSPANIKITLHDITFKQLDKNSATVSFNQLYQTPDYSDKTHKLMEFVREDNQWLILRESSFTANVDLKLKR